MLYSLLAVIRTIKLLAVLLLLAAAASFYPPFRLSLLVLLGRSPGCPLAQALQSADNQRRQVEIKDRILSASRLIQKDPAGFHLWETPKGRFWIPRGSDWSLPWDLAEQERKIYGAGGNAVRAGDIVLDCGANVGVYVREALAAGARLVVAIELAPENLECLRRNFAAEIPAGRVIVYPKGVWDRDDWLTLNVDPENSAADSVVIRPEKAYLGPKVPLTTIDKLVAELNSSGSISSRRTSRGPSRRRSWARRPRWPDTGPVWLCRPITARMTPSRSRSWCAAPGPVTRWSAVPARMSLPTSGPIFYIFTR